MSKLLHKVCDLLHYGNDNGHIKIDDNHFRVYVRKVQAKNYIHNMSNNHKHEFTHLSMGREYTSKGIYEHNIKTSKYVNIKRCDNKVRTYYIEFKFTDTAFALYQNYKEWVNL